MNYEIDISKTWSLPFYQHKNHPSHHFPLKCLPTSWKTEEACFLPDLSLVLPFWFRLFHNELQWRSSKSLRRFLWWRQHECSRHYCPRTTLEYELKFQFKKYLIFDICKGKTAHHSHIFIFISRMIWHKNLKKLLTVQKVFRNKKNCHRMLLHSRISRKLEKSKKMTKNKDFKFGL